MGGELPGQELRAGRQQALDAGARGFLLKEAPLADLVRAAGDSLHRVRFLLLTAYSLDGLGPHWLDRLVSALQRQVGYLDEPDARNLVTEPIEGFPDIYPPGGVDRILRETHCHPYLIQLVCDHLTKRLNDNSRLKADDGDLEAAFDLATAQTPLFPELWRQRSEDEKAILKALALGQDPPDQTRPTLRQLEKQGYVTRRDNRPTIAVPLFSAWIQDRYA